MLLPLQKSPRTSNCFLVERLWDSKPPSLSKNRQQLHKIFKNVSFQVFLSISVWIWCFSSTNCFYLFKEDSWPTMFSLLNVFEILSHQVFRKIDNNCIKFSKIWIFKYFCQFRSEFDAFFLAEIALISSKKPLGQQFLSFLNVFNILSHQVIRKVDKNCMKFSKIWSFWDCCHFRSEFEAFFESNCIYNFDDASWAAKSFFVECF